MSEGEKKILKFSPLCHFFAFYYFIRRSFTNGKKNVHIHLRNFNEKTDG